MKKKKEEEIVFANTIQKIKAFLDSIRSINAQYSEVAPYVQKEKQLNGLLELNVSIYKGITRCEKILGKLRPFLSSELKKTCDELLETVREEKEKTEDNIEGLALCLSEEFKSSLEERLKNIVPPRLLTEFQRHKSD